MLFAEEISSNPTWVTVIIALGTLLSGGLGAWIINMYMTTKKEAREDKDQDSKTRLSESQQAFEVYKELVTSLRTDMKTVSEHLKSIEDAEKKCRQDNAQAQIRIMSLEEQDKLNKERITILEEKLNSATKSKP